jgi:ribose-phosphate pyrophosphokinase
VIIDTDNYIADGITVIKFPGGELHANVPDPQEDHVHIFAKIRSWTDFGHYLLVADAYRRHGVKVHTFMPYLPGARQDRVQPGYALTSEIYAQAIGGVTDTLTAVDVHSPAAEAIYGDVTHLRVLGFKHLKWLFANEKPFDIVLAADKGGVERAESIADLLGVREVMYCTKKRNPNNGALTGFDVPDISDKTHNNARILIPDDICDGGGTFVGIVKKIAEKAYTPSYHLYVTHGIFSKGLEPLIGPKSGNFRDFTKVFTTNSWTTELPSERLQIADLLPYYLESLTP